MKKILLASSALVLVGGAAFAETSVTLSGSAEMGFYGGEFNNNVENESTTIDAQFWSDMDVTFTLSGETDSGVTFGAAIDLDDVAENGGIGSTTDQDFAVFIQGDFGTVTLGDTDGAFDWAMQDTNFGMAGTLNDAEEHLGYDGMNLLDGFYDGQIARYDYSFGDFSFAVSAEIDDDASEDDGTVTEETVTDTDLADLGLPGEGTIPVTTTETSQGTDYDDPMLGLGAKYTLDLADGSVNFGAAYQGNDGDNYIAGLSVAGTFAGFSAGIAYYDGTVAGLAIGLNSDGTNLELQTGDENSGESNDITYVGGSLAYNFDAITVGVNAGSYDIEDVDTAYGWGITAAYDLGGGLELQAGYGYSEAETDDDTNIDFDAYTYSFGVAMSF